MHGEVAVIYFKNSILQLKHYLSVMGPGILSIAKLKLSITLIKSTAPKKHTHTHKRRHTLFFLPFFFFFNTKEPANVSIVRRYHPYFNNEGFTKQNPSERRLSGEVLSSTFKAGFVSVMASYSENSSCLLLPRHSWCPSANVFLKTLISLTRGRSSDAFLLSVTHWRKLGLHALNK